MAESELIVRESFDAIRIFNDPEGIDKILRGIEEKVTGIIPDLSTNKGRKEIASLAYKVAQSKVLLISEGKKLTEDWRTKTQKVNADCSKIETFCNSLKDRVREPLTEWEKVEEERIKSEAETIKYASDWEEAHKEHALFLRLKDLERQEAELAALKAAQLAKEQAEREAEEARQTEIARQQQREIDEANRLEREKRIAEEAAKRAIKDAEEKAERERKAAEQRLIDAESKRIADLAAQQAKAEAEKKAIAEAQERARIEAERKRLADIQAEKDRAEKEKQAMIEAQAKKDREAAELAAKEQARIAAEKAEEEKRQKNVAHQKKINNEAYASLQRIPGVDDIVAEKIVKAIAKGQVANVFIRY